MILFFTVGNHIQYCTVIVVVRRRNCTHTGLFFSSRLVSSACVQSVTMDTSYHQQQPPQGVQSTGYNNANINMNCQTSPIQSQYQQQQQQQQTGTIHGSHGNLSNVSEGLGWWSLEARSTSATLCRSLKRISRVTGVHSVGPVPAPVPI